MTTQNIVLLLLLITVVAIFIKAFAHDHSDHAWYKNQQKFFRGKGHYKEFKKYKP